MSAPIITAQQQEDLDALVKTFVAFRSVFDGDESTPATLRMTSAACRRAADTIDEIAEAWLRRERAS